MFHCVKFYSAAAYFIVELEERAQENRVKIGWVGRTDRMGDKESSWKTEEDNNMEQSHFRKSVGRVASP